jgi:aldehyde:ferredoxin oxidoreductase
MGRVLKIDLAKKTSEEYPWSDNDRELYLGGKIMAAKIIYDNIKHKIDPFSKDNILAVTTGPLTGTDAPSSSRFNISTVSPLTGLLTSSNCGGSFGIYLKKAGYDALVITGRSEKPVWIEIDEDNVLFHDAGMLWGMTTGAVQESLGSGKGKIVIGPAGENLVRYAGVFSDERAAGRAGVGAVMGSNSLKAVTASGSRVPPVHDGLRMRKHYRMWEKRLKDNPFNGKQLPKLGTAALLSSMNIHRVLPTHNYKYGQYEDFEMVSGEYLAEKYTVRNKGCTSCPTKCQRVVELDGRQIKGPELETLVLLGPNIENNDLEKIIRWNYLLDELGMDTISTGGTIAFAMELNEKGLWDNGLEFGRTDNLSSIFEDIAFRRDIGSLLAEGTRRLSERFGGREFAIHSKGLELAAYEPRGAVGQGLGYAVANRGGCHINGGNLVALEGLGLSIDPYTPDSKAALAVMFENIMEAAAAGGNCIFTMSATLPPLLYYKPYSIITRFVNRNLPKAGKLINIINRMPGNLMPIHLPSIPHTRAIRYVTGMKINFGRFRDIGERGYNLERLFNVRMGVTSSDDTLPGRLTDEAQVPGDERTKVPLEVMKKEYYRIRGWDKNGVPMPQKLKKLKLGGEI